MPIDTSKIITAAQKTEVEQAATKKAFEFAIQAHVDAVAVSKDFRDGVTLASYVASTNALWAAQAQAFVAWRDRIWAYAYAELAKVLAGQRTQPTVAEFITELQPIEWTS